MFYFLKIEEKFYLTPERRIEVLYFESTEALHEYRKKFDEEKSELKRIIQSGVSCIKNGQLCPTDR